MPKMDWKTYCVAEVQAYCDAGGDVNVVLEEDEYSPTALMVVATRKVRLEVFWCCCFAHLALG